MSAETEKEIPKVYMLQATPAVVAMLTSCLALMKGVVRGDIELQIDAPHDFGALFAAHPGELKAFGEMTMKMYPREVHHRILEAARAKTYECESCGRYHLREKGHPE